MTHRQVIIALPRPGEQIATGFAVYCDPLHITRIEPINGRVRNRVRNPGTGGMSDFGTEKVSERKRCQEPLFLRSSLNHPPGNGCWHVFLRSALRASGRSGRWRRWPGRPDCSRLRGSKRRGRRRAHGQVPSGRRSDRVVLGRPVPGGPAGRRGGRRNRRRG